MCRDSIGLVIFLECVLSRFDHRCPSGAVCLHLSHSLSLCLQHPLSRPVTLRPAGLCGIAILGSLECSVHLTRDMCKPEYAPPLGAELRRKLSTLIAREFDRMHPSALSACTTVSSSFPASDSRCPPLFVYIRLNSRLDLAPLRTRRPQVRAYIRHESSAHGCFLIPND